jgi:hypothetical protein
MIGVVIHIHMYTTTLFMRDWAVVLRLEEALKEQEIVKLVSKPQDANKLVVESHEARQIKLMHYIGKAIAIENEPNVMSLLVVLVIISFFFLNPVSDLRTY